MNNIMTLILHDQIADEKQQNESEFKFIAE